MNKRLIIRSEEDFVQGLLAPLAQGFSGALGLHDDAALIDVPVGSQLVVTTDALVAGVHFFADDAPEDIALKALGVNVSDLASKAADPLAYQLSLALPRDLDTDWLARFAEGLRQGQADWSLGLAGGDTVRTPGPLCLCVTAFGCVPTGAMVLRSGARTGDRLFVTGTLGDAALGLGQAIAALAGGGHA
jgi:thiamine-monophosphate kinase